QPVKGGRASCLYRFSNGLFLESHSAPVSRYNRAPTPIPGKSNREASQTKNRSKAALTWRLKWARRQTNQEIWHQVGPG
ncbi:MAG: hypothetical protein ACREXG_15060, partial [Polaromonas sp.]